MTGFTRNVDDTMRIIGVQVLALRATKPPAPWKEIETIYGRDRVTLWRYAQLVQPGLGSEKDVADVSYETSATSSASTK